MVKRVLMIAYHYPPVCGGSGMQRTAAFTQHLPQSGWEPVVLSVSLNAYAEWARAAEPRVQAHRSFALDAARQLSIQGRYPALLTQPDRWSSWWLSAVPTGLALIRKFRPQVIWSTYPIATAHLIGMTLHRLTGLPWIADQRDPMIDQDYPPDARRYRIHRWIEQQAAQRAAAIVCTTPMAARDLARRHGANTAISLIENGYDEAGFIAAELLPAPVQDAQKPFRLLHSGAIYPSERDPRALFAALTRLLATNVINPGNFRLVLRATGHDDYLRGLIQQHPGLQALVELAPPLPYQAALAEMLHADGLLLLQAGNCNGQIPAKLYEYLRARRPLLALTHPDGDTAATLRNAGIHTIARLNSAEEIAVKLPEFLNLCHEQRAPLAPADVVVRHARAARTRELAALLDQICKEPL